jgi:hypothetical protein
MRLILLVAIWMAATASAQDPRNDPRLDALHATLATLYSHAAEVDPQNRGARPELTVAKHELRDWIELQLSGLKYAQDTKPLSDRINTALKAVGIPESGADESLLGSVGEVRFSNDSDLLIVTTGVGIVCGYDESAYGYQFMNGAWKRVWESEQNDYAPQKYAPQHIIAVQVSQAFGGGSVSGPPFVMTLGNQSSCASAWHPVYYRVWRVDPAGPKLLLDGAEGAWLRTEIYAVGSIAQDRSIRNPPVDVLIEFTQGSVDVTVHNREAVRHFLISGDQVRRVGPVALGPRDFVDEWLTRGWSESAGWSAAPALQQWHGKLHTGVFGGEFAGTMRCETPELWQVAFAPHDANKDLEAGPPAYFLVQWRPPYQFTMMSVSDKPSPLCTQEDREADAWRTLFSTQEWRR